MLPEFIKTNDHFRHQRYVHALEQSFLQFDQSLLLDECNQCLNNIRCRHESYNPTIIRRQRNPLVAVDTGCTAVVALLSKTGHFYVANIGDSRCVMRVKGKTIPLSNDHKPTDVQERQRIEGAGCYVVNGRINHGLNLSRAFGDHLLKNNIHITASEQAVTALPDVTVCKERIRSGDFIVLACDGVWNCMSNKEVCSLVRKHIKRGVQLSKICELVVRRCVSPVRPLNGQIGGDNMTCMIVRFDREIP
ncbi:hypothetical protein RDWZM_007491 [Blomia tropicalis]|uniref:protein-serine/threonine phosphatase n=1 Tax=Blomia tropicalis TaxID=40697 RepID=A0A9Q0LZV5_BLOTA|nr:hypothetical protein RDWZM_007491 [Blomia tropicalis]